MPRKPKLRTLATVVTFLEMTAGCADPCRAPPVNMKLALMRAKSPPLHFYRYLYEVIGQDYYWINSKDMPDRALAELIQHPDVQVRYTAYVAGVPAPLELDRRRGWLVGSYLGLVPDFKGRGLGKWLLSEAIATAWSEPTGRLIVETCTLDAPKALSLYQRFGFVPYAREEKVIEVRDDA